MTPGYPPAHLEPIVKHLPRPEPHDDGRPVTLCGIVNVPPPAPDDAPCLICQGRAAGLSQEQAIAASQRVVEE